MTTRAPALSVAFTVEGEPVPKQRPRFANGRAYTPKKTEDYADVVGKVAGIAMQARDPLDGDLAAYMVFYRKNHVRADVDNLIKGITDPCNGIVWGDDKQIVIVHARVVYGSDNPRAVLRVRQVATPPAPKPKRKRKRKTKAQPETAVGEQTCDPK